MKYLLFTLLLLFTSLNLYSINEDKSKKLNCKPFLKGSFFDYSQLENSKHIIKRFDDNSYIYDLDGTTIIVKSKLEIVKNCILKFKIYELNNPSLSNKQKEEVMAFNSIEEIYKIEGNTAYYRGLNCKCKGYYVKFEE
ncbi:hypothetical protein EHQ24_16775 [Leptospira noumeaensis]|uniref:Uncharacterized protein n=1 Tax=Leptospira noumeaensis TaxID=2484964 RepID=A0A4R9I0F8_9LEPT|nr:hypothetical protein [Leptospira noumeaensis]TGK78654.1 hypothetical protein EHQ24_16775 [Leptospira noumeaensis]